MTTREDKLCVWEDMTRELFPEVDMAELLVSVPLRPIVWLAEPVLLIGGGTSRELFPGWVDRRAMRGLSNQRIDFTKVYEG